MKNESAQCRLARSHDLSLVYDAGNRPIAHRLLENAEASEEVFPLALHVSESSGLIQVCAPIDPKILYQNYNYCFSSWKPEPHMPDELDLICRHVQNGSVFEIGCNDGRFLQELKDRGQRILVGLEPNTVAGSIARNRRFEVMPTFLDEQSAREAVARHGLFDLVVSRQVLEHIHDLELFFRCVRILLKDDGFLFVDVPDVEPGLRYGDITILWEEHVNYFTEEVLHRTLHHFGFNPHTLKKYNFSGGCLAAFCQKMPSGQIAELLQRKYRPEAGFSERVGTFRKHLIDRLETARNVGIKVILYGTGCRACALVNCLDIGAWIDFAVDDQLERVGKFMPGSRVEIFSSDILPMQETPCLVLLAVNCENEEKVCRRFVKENTPSYLTFLSVLSPNSSLFHER